MRFVTILIGVVLLTSCAAVKSRTLYAEGHRDAAITGPIAVFPVSTALSLANSGGALETRADWSEDASVRFTRAMFERLEANGVAIRPVDTSIGVTEGAILGITNAWELLFKAFQVGEKHAIRDDFALPPAQAAAVGEAVDADYLLLSFIGGSYASAGRRGRQAAVNTLGVVTSAVLGVGYFEGGGGGQGGVAGLYDLFSGRLIWARRDGLTALDLRDDADAEAVIDLILEGAPLD